MRRLIRDGLILLGAAVGYYGCAVIGTLLSVPPSGFAVIWPATAFLISLLLILPPRQWWLVVAGVVPTHFFLAATFQPEAPLIVVLTQIAGNCALAAATVAALRATIGSRHLFDSFASVLKFILVAGLAVPALVNALAIAVHLATGWTDGFWLAWRQWMIAGIFPTVTLPPLLVLAWEGRLTGERSGAARAGLELAMLAALLFGLSYVAFGNRLDTAHWPALFLAPFPFLLWAAVRLGVGGTAFALIVLAVATVARALGHQGPFAAQSSADDVLSLQAFLATSSIPLILLAALVDERRRAAELRRQSEARLQVAASSTDTGLWQWDEQAQYLWLTGNCRAMFGLSDDTGFTPFSFLDAAHPDDRTALAAAIEAALMGGDAQAPVEFRLCSDGETRWFVLYTCTDLDDAGKPARVSGVFRDVSDRVEAQLEADDLRQRLLCMQDDERRRIAEELHDSTAQHLVAANLNLFHVKAKVAPELQPLVDEVLQSVREAATEIRTFSYLLHPPQLGNEGLSRVLRHYVPGFERRTGVRTSLRVSPVANQLPPDHQHAMLRIVQESLGNVHRHARATRVSVCVRCIAGNVHLVVRDDGEGIGSEAGERLGERLRLGVGIPAMTARVRQMGGRIDVNNRFTGTTIHVAVPLHAVLDEEEVEPVDGPPLDRFG
ncbi:MAG TPA: MASE1 domain-containing protein [Allosphingosinicella sp.]